MEAQAKILRDKSPQNKATLLGVEGSAALSYFQSWYTLPLKWKNLNKKPIPPEWHQIGSRIGNSKSNQFALHPVNAILNYAYAILEHEVCGHILTYGADPTIGYLHANEPGRHALVFDLMEPLRPIMDRKVLKFVLEHTFCPDDFILNKNGICRLHPQFARCVVKAVQDTQSGGQLRSVSVICCWDYRDQVRPFNFLLSIQTNETRPNQSTYKKKQEPIRPVAPYDKDIRQAIRQAFDRLTGKPINPNQLKTYRESLAQYHLHPEDKFLNGDYLDHGFTQRRHIHVKTMQHIGKEANKWEEQYFTGHDPDSQLEYASRLFSQCLHDDAGVPIDGIPDHRLHRLLTHLIKPISIFMPIQRL